ncbi:MAG: 23S rRNA (adenine(2503)-C(2))-methyltransferase RlmN [Sedimentisphaerales bacterium]|nr:23S rRNA (adenine(2503)-C(2))-methyltransferase RlmN [Sedimentisphaerales bacterium]
MNKNMINILGLTRQQLKDSLSEHGHPSYRADQILEWIYQRRVLDFAEMSNLSKTLRAELGENFTLGSSVVQDVQRCPDETTKFLLRWPDNALTETVLIPDVSRNTVCVSSQVGCAVGCAFCASGLDGLKRSLSAAEIVEQVMRAQAELPETQRVSNVVVMGMGEPLANYDSVIRAVSIINAEWSLNIGARHITVSTIGIPKMIRKLAHEKLQITLAVSLHAGDDQLRKKLVPWSDKFTLPQIFAAIDYYYEKTHREVTLEYILLEGVNCSPADADKLARLAQGSRCNVNLINYNPVAETGFEPASRQTVLAFQQRLQSRGVNVHLRKSRGQQIDAACGQLRRRSQSATK